LEQLGLAASESTDDRVRSLGWILDQQLEALEPVTRALALRLGADVGQAVAESENAIEAGEKAAVKVRSGIETCHHLLERALDLLPVGGGPIERLVADIEEYFEGSGL
jgi:hypothetical protein